MKNRKKSRVIARSRSSAARRAKRSRPTIKFARKQAKKAAKAKIAKRARPALKRKLRGPAKKAAGKRRDAPSQKSCIRHYEALLNNAGLRQTFINVAGENAIMIIREFKGQMSDDELAMKTKIKVSEVRAVLNKLHSFGLVEYVRHRDKDSGWYSYVWKINPEKARTLLASFVEGESATVVSGDHYICHSCDSRELFHFDRAYELSFRCPGCGSNLNYFEKKKE
jgi:transcription initiation factor TFIIE subunit alpha